MHVRITLALAGMAGAALLTVAPPALAKDKNDLTRGAYLVHISGCSDCHTPMKMGPKGPEPDLARGMSGHPQDMQLPPPPAASGPWIWGGSASMTAFYGPWGVSYSANLTPDKDTGLGNWTADQFVQTMKTGKHLGTGRPILPPMPWQSLGNMTDRDLKLVFRYLMAQPAVKNAVPQPLPPKG